MAACIPGKICFDSIKSEQSFEIEDSDTHATLLRDGRKGVVTPVLSWHEADT